MRIKKGDKIHFRARNETETVVKSSSNPITGMIITDKQEYSIDFISRWKQFGFLTILPKMKK